jgi:hypothetical protein
MNIVHTTVEHSTLLVMIHVMKNLDKTNLIYSFLSRMLFYHFQNLVIECVNE